MSDNPQERYKCGFICTKNLYIELIKHLDGHYYFYLNGNMTDVMIPRSVENNGSITWPTSLKQLYDIKEHIWYGKSKYNQSFFENLLNKDNFAEYYI